MDERHLHRIQDSDFKEANDAREFVRAFIVNTALPKTVLEVLEEGCEGYGESNRYDIEGILQGEAEGGWSVPKWAKPGDVVFFMLSRTSSYTAKKLRKDYDREKDGYRLVERNVIEPMLDRADWLARNYAGKLVAVGRVSSLPYIGESPIRHSHYKSRIFADISQETLLQRPVDISEFSDFQLIGRGVTVTPVLGRNFEKLRDVISAGNNLPVYVTEACATPDFCRDINAKNWMSLSGKYRRSFMLEDEFRSCYLDYLLEELSEGPVYREVRLKKKSGFGVVDNIVILGGKYVYVEAKLDVLAEPHLDRQLRKYCHVRSIMFDANTIVSGRRAFNDAVLVFDTEAAYLYLDSKHSGLQRLFSLNRCAELGVEGMRSIILDSLLE